MSRAAVGDNINCRMDLLSSAASSVRTRAHLHEPRSLAGTHASGIPSHMDGAKILINGHEH